MERVFPDGLLYTRDHEWCRIDGDQAVVGITWHAQDALGDVVYCELPEVGAELVAGEAFGVVESVKAVSDLYAPLSGVVVKRNQAVVDAPEMLNQDCYDKAWLLQVEIQEPKQVSELLSRAQYEDFLSNENDE